VAKERTIPEQQERGLAPPNSMTQATPIYAGGLPGTPPDVVPDPFPPPSPEPDVPGFPEPDPDPDPLDPEPTPAPIN
jgi:segregation and condensation protein B